MVRRDNGGVTVAVEVWTVPAPPARPWPQSYYRNRRAFTVGQVKLADGSEVLGVLGEPACGEGHREITRFGGWRVT